MSRLREALLILLAITAVVCVGLWAFGIVEPQSRGFHITRALFLTVVVVLPLLWRYWRR